MQMARHIPARRMSSLSLSSKIAAAEDPNCSPDMLKILATDPEEAVATAVAKNPRIPVSVIRYLQVRYVNSNPYVILELAKNPQTPTSLLRKMYMNGTWFIQDAIIARSDSNFPTELLLSAAKHCDPTGYLAIANRNFPVNELRKLASHSVNNVRRSVADNPSCPPDILEKLSADSDAAVRRGVAKNTYTPPEILEAMADVEQKLDVQAELLSNINTPERVLYKFMHNASVNLLYAIAANRKCPPDILEFLANPRLYASKDTKAVHKIFTLIAGHLNVSPGILDRLHRSTNIFSLDLNIALNANVRDDTLVDIFMRSIRQGQSTNILISNLPDISRIFKTVDVSRLGLSVREATALHPNCPPGILSLLSKDEKDAVRYNVAGNPNTPGPVLEEMIQASGRDPKLDAAVRNNPSCPEHLKYLFDLAD